MERPKSTVVITEFPGLVSNRGRFPSHPGEALVQTNLRTIRQGCVESRLGSRNLAYTAGQNPGNGSNDIISFFYYDNTIPLVVVEDATGAVYSGTSPA